jgi:beta-lactamase class A
MGHATPRPEGNRGAPKPSRRRQRPSLTITAAIIQVVGGTVGALLVGLILAILQEEVPFRTGTYILGSALLFLALLAVLYMRSPRGKAMAATSAAGGLALLVTGSIADPPPFLRGSPMSATQTAGTVTECPGVPPAPIIRPMTATSQAPVDPALERSVEQLFAGLPPGASAVFQNLAGPGGIERRERVTFRDQLAEVEVPAASAIKLPLMVAAFKRAEIDQRMPPDRVLQVPPNLVDPRNPGTGVLHGHIGCSLTTRRLLEVTLAHSDNLGGNMLIELLGGVREVNIVLRGDLGFRHTELKRQFMDRGARGADLENITSAEDMAEMLRTIYRREMVSPSASAEMLRILGLRESQEEPFLHFLDGDLRRLRPRPTVAHVNGLLSGVRNDSAIIDADGHVYIVTIFLQDQVDEAAAERAIARVSRQVFDLVSRRP